MAESTPITFSELTFSSLISKSWELFKKNWQLLGGIALITFGINLVSNRIQMNLQDSMPVAAAFFRLAMSALSIFISMGWMNVSIKLVRTGQATFEDMYSLQDHFWNYLLGTIYAGVIIMLGFLLLIVPGIMWALKYMFVSYLIVDKNLTASVALETSKKMTTGIRWKLFGYALGFAGINILGLLALGVGLIVSAPVTALAATMIYESLLDRAQS